MMYLSDSLLTGKSSIVIASTIANYTQAIPVLDILIRELATENAEMRQRLEILERTPITILIPSRVNEWKYNCNVCNAQILVCVRNRAIPSPYHIMCVECQQHYTLIQKNTAISSGFHDRNFKLICEGDHVKWCNEEYIVKFDKFANEWILKDDRPDYECPALAGIQSPGMSRLELIEETI